MNKRQFVQSSLAGLAGSSLAEILSRADETPIQRPPTSFSSCVFPEGNIRRLTQHFDDPDGNIAPWISVPTENIGRLSTSDSLSMAAIWPAGEERDIKAILETPIRFEEYPFPWEFRLGMVQNFSAMAYVKAQSNYAIGLNVAVTFSDPSKWPRDRTQMPPDTHSLQLLVVHLSGLPQYSNLPQADNYFVWGRGDLDHNLTGDLRIPFVRIGDGACAWGPASNGLYFRFVFRNPGGKKVQSPPAEPAKTSPNPFLGIKFDAGHGSA